LLAIDEESRMGETERDRGKIIEATGR